jgi:Protein of unknown function (DUF1493)
MRLETGFQICHTKPNCMDKILNEIKEFTAKFSGVNLNKIQEDSGIESDLGIYGDDGVDYIIAFGKKFNVDISAFTPRYYFSAEGVDFLGPVIDLFRKGEDEPKRDLKIRHLVKAVIEGRLDEEVINS